MLHLPPLPRTVKLLLNDDSERLDKLNPTLSRSLDDCVTCSGKKRFRWYGCASIEGAPSNVIDEYECSCKEQWILHRWLLAAGVGTTYQRYGWNDVDTEPGAAEKVQDYLMSAEGYVNAGCGMILYGPPGTGKTLLSVLSVKGLIALGYDCHFTTFSTMLDVFMSAWRDDDERTWFYNRIKNTGILVIDDIGKEFRQQRFVKSADYSGMVDYSTATAKTSLDEVIRHRVANSLPTLITTNLDINALSEGYGEGIISLLQESSTVFQFTGEDYRKSVRLRIDDEVKRGLRRPLVLA